MLKAQANVQTEKASRYLKALCNHFSHKVTAEYSDERGVVQFGFGYCEMQATDNTLNLQVQAEDDENFQRVKHVVGDHLIRFGTNEELVVNWTDEA